MLSRGHATATYGRPVQSAKVKVPERKSIPYFPVIVGSGSPTENTGTVGQMYMDSSTTTPTWYGPKGRPFISGSSHTWGGAIP